MSEINVNICRVFEGPRHDRLHLLHDVLAEVYQKQYRLHWWANTRRVGHAAALEAMWEEELRRPERYAVIVEHDFLPNTALWLDLRLLDDEHPVVSCRYVTRHPETHRLLAHNAVGPWYVMVDKARVRKLHWEPWGEFNDPGNGLAHYLEQEYPGMGVRLLEPRDDMPRSFGVQYRTGLHLFWSRHLHDPAYMRVAGVCLGDMQAKHDQAVTEWLAAAPAAVIRTARRRGLE